MSAAVLLVVLVVVLAGGVAKRVLSWIVSGCFGVMMRSYDGEDSIRP